MHPFPPASRSFRSRGFTLIELLTVIAIIGILAAILIPTIGRVRTTARRAQGLSNLRQVTLAGISYLNENKNIWYYTTNRQRASSPDDAAYYYPKYLTRYLNSQAVTNRPFGDYFYDPMVPVRSDNSLHFAACRVLFGEISTKFNNLGRIKTPASQVFFADSYVDPNGISGATVQNTGVDAYSAPYVQPSDANARVLPPADYPQQVMNLDLTRDKGQTKLGFLDGHVALVKRDALFQRLFNPVFNL